MHDTVDPEVSTRLAALLTCEGWPLMRQLFSDSELIQIQIIRHCPLGPEAEAAAVKLAHIEELRDLIRSITPQHVGDPFDVAERPTEPRIGPTAPVPGDAELEFDDDYEL